MLFLLDLHDGAILESPLDNVGLCTCTLDEFALAQGRPELREVLQLDEMPNVGKRGWLVVSFVKELVGRAVPLMTADSVTEVLVGIWLDILEIFMMCIKDLDVGGTKLGMYLQCCNYLP